MRVDRQVQALVRGTGWWDLKNQFHLTNTNRCRRTCLSLTLRSNHLGGSFHPGRSLVSKITNLIFNDFRTC